MQKAPLLHVFKLICLTVVTIPSVICQRLLNENQFGALKLRRRQLFMYVIGFDLEAVKSLSLVSYSDKPQIILLRVPACLPKCILFKGLCVCEEQQERQCHAQLSSVWVEGHSALKCSSDHTNAPNIFLDTLGFWKSSSLMYNEGQVRQIFRFGPTWYPITANNHCPNTQ